MLYNLGNPPPPRRKIPWVPIAVGLTLLVLIVGVIVFGFSSPTIAKSLKPPPAAPIAATGWKIDVGFESKSGQHFGGKFLPGAVFYVPANAPFEVVPEPAGAAGEFVENSSGGVWDHAGGELNPAAKAANGWQQACRAPAQAGLYHLVWLPRENIPSAERMTLEVLVLTEAECEPKGDRTKLTVNGKSIGAYPDPAKSTLRRVRENAALYRPPQWFANLTAETIPLRLGENFDLGQLVAFKDYHGPDGKKVFTTQRHTDVLALRPELIDKLIKLRARLRSQGVKVTRFWITSGFRTPDYNHSIGGAMYSRHCYGDAVDICIDEDDDKHMDDINGDGRIDRKDGIIIANACRELEAEGAVVPGGIGVYEWTGDDSVRSHVHIDCRGYVSRWGQVDSGRHRKNFTWWPKSEFQEEDGGD